MRPEDHEQILMYVFEKYTCPERVNISVFLSSDGMQCKPKCVNSRKRVKSVFFHIIESIYF